jgi:serine/threonine protein kinase
MAVAQLNLPNSSAGNSPLPFFAPGHVIAGRYRVIRPLGRGGMASVYLAEDTVLGESEVAVKILQDRFQGGQSLVDRFIREVRLTHKIHHRNVVRTFDFGQDGSTLFYTMEYLPGDSLESLVQQGASAPPVVMQIAAQLLRGLAAVHGVGVIHRDLKPANVIVAADGTLKITDFGVARVSAAPATLFAKDVLGTVAYVAPEVLRGEQPTKAVDFYALGVVLYELLTGVLPFEDDNTGRLIIRKLEEDAQSVRELRADLPEWFADAIDGLLERDLAQRMKAVDQLAVGLDMYARGGDGRSIREDLFPSEKPFVNRTTRIIPRIEASIKSYSKLSLVQSLLIILCALFAIPISATDSFSKLELEYLDSLFALRGPRVAHKDVIVVSMDEQSYAQLGVPLTSPWPRALHARLLDVLADAGAKRVVFDVIFADATAGNADDRALAGAMSRVPTVLGAALGFSQRATINGAFLLEELLKPAAIFEAQSVGIGVVGMPQKFGRVRSFLDSPSEVFPNLSSLGEMGVIVDREGSRLPDANSLINFYGPSKSIPTVPYEMVVSDQGARFPTDMFRGKVVFVGLGLRSSTGPSQRDAFITPFDAATYGTEVHATVASNLLANDWIRQPAGWISCCIQVGVAAFAAWLVFSLSGPGAVLILALVGGLFAVGALALFYAGWFVPAATGVMWGLFSGLLLRIVLAQSASRRARRAA